MQPPQYAAQLQHAQLQHDLTGQLQHAQRWLDCMRGGNLRRHRMATLAGVNRATRSRAVPDSHPIVRNRNKNTRTVMLQWNNVIQRMSHGALSLVRIAHGLPNLTIGRAQVSFLKKY